MIYLPKTFERYLSALRLYVQMSVLKDSGVKQLSQLKLINLAEAFYYKKEKTPTDIIKLSNSLLGAAVIMLMQRGIRLFTSFSGDGVQLISKRLYTAFLSELIYLSHDGSEIKVSTEYGNVIIKATGVGTSDILLRLINALEGFFLFERVSDKWLIAIPTEPTELKADAVENEWCYILDRFSPINIWLLNTKKDNNS